MKRTTSLATLVLVMLALFSCKKTTEINQPTVTNAHDKNSTNTVNDVITQSRNLTIAYYIPSDLDTIANFKNRLTGVLSWIQNYYGQEMQRNGFGFKTFGLVKEGTSQKVQVNVIRSTSTKANFNIATAVTEVNNYFNSNPGLKQSQHVLILLPPFNQNSNGEPTGGNPFYGYGRYCFALDYIGLDIANVGTDPFTKWLGGTAHELGHAFNASHDMNKVSEAGPLGTALMGAGNYTLGKTPTYITLAEAAIFNQCEVFNNNTNTYYGAVTTNVTKINANYDAPSSSIIVSGRFTSTGNVTHITFYNDPNVNNEGTGTNKDYNAVAWASPKIGTDSFRMVMPISELQQKANGIPYELKLRLVHDNGIVNQVIYAYTFSGGIPVINFGTRPELSKTGWTIASFSTQQNTTSESASKVLDNNTTTFWHSKWSGSPTGTYPHYLTIALGSSKTAKGISFLHREGANRAIKNFEILTSTDGANFTSRGNYVTANITSKQYFDFSSPQTFTHFKIVANSSWDGTQNAAIAELGLYN
jgi:hypothetical protein